MISDVDAEQDDHGWTIRFAGSLVTQLRVDYCFSMLLDGGALLMVEGPFVLDFGYGPHCVPPGEVVHDVAYALPLFNQRVGLVRADATDTPLIEFEGGAVVTVAVTPYYENWQIVMPDGQQWIGLPGGGVQHIDTA